MCPERLRAPPPPFPCCVIPRLSPASGSGPQDIWYSGQVLDAVKWPEVINNPKVTVLHGEVSAAGAGRLEHR